MYTFTCDVITKTCCGFELQSTSSDLKEIAHLHIFCDWIYFNFSYRNEEEKKPHLGCTWGSPIPLGPCHGSKIFSSVRHGTAVLWSKSWVTRRCSFHWMTCCPVRMVLPWPAALGSFWGRAWVQSYPFSCLQTPLPRCTRESISKRQSQDPHCSEAQCCFFSFPTSSQPRRNFFLAWGRK